MLRITGFTNCCNAKIISGFGGTNTANRGYHNDDATIQDLRIMINGIIKNEAQNLLVAITNDQQTRANKALKLCGFESTPWMSKLWHPETRMRLWFRRPETNKAKLVNPPIYLR